MNKKYFIIFFPIFLIGFVLFLNLMIQDKISSDSHGSAPPIKWRKINDTVNGFELEVPETWSEAFYEVSDDIKIDPNRKGIRGWQFFSNQRKDEVGPEASFDLSFFKLVQPKSLEELVKSDDELMNAPDPTTDIVQPPTSMTLSGFSAIQYQVDNEGGVGEGGYFREIFIQRGDEIIEIEMATHDHETYQKYEILFDQMLERLDFLTSSLLTSMPI